jgi:hypothetical protein
MLSALVRASFDGRSATLLPSSSAQTTVMLEKGEKSKSGRSVASFAGALVAFVRARESWGDPRRAQPRRAAARGKEHVFADP